MQPYTYTVWIEVDSDEVDHQLNVLASSQGGAQEWGDKLAKRMCSRRSTSFLRSEISDQATGVGTLPTVVYGHYPSDEDIGW